MNVINLSNSSLLKKQQPFILEETFSLHLYLKFILIVKIFKLMQIFSENAYSTCFIKRELSCFG